MKFLRKFRRPYYYRIDESRIDRRTDEIISEDDLIQDYISSRYMDGEIGIQNTGNPQKFKRKG